MAEDPIERTLGRMEGKLDELTNLHKESSKRMSSIDTRLTKVETWQTKALGYGGGAVAVISIIWAVVKEVM